MASVAPSNRTTSTFGPPCSAREGVGRRADQHADRPAAAARLGLLQVGPGPDRAAAPHHQLQLVDVVRPGRQVIAGRVLGPLVAVDHEVDPARVENLEQLVPLALREPAVDAQVLAPDGPSTRLRSRSRRAANGDRDRHKARPLPCRCRRAVARSGEPARARHLGRGESAARRQTSKIKTKPARTAGETKTGESLRPGDWRSRERSAVIQRRAMRPMRRVGHQRHRIPMRRAFLPSRSSLRWGTS